MGETVSSQEPKKFSLTFLNSICLFNPPNLRSWIQSVMLKCEIDKLQCGYLANMKICVPYVSSNIQELFAQSNIWQPELPELFSAVQSHVCYLWQRVCEACVFNHGGDDFWGRIRPYIYMLMRLQGGGDCVRSANQRACWITKWILQYFLPFGDALNRSRTCFRMWKIRLLPWSHPELHRLTQHFTVCLLGRYYVNGVMYMELASHTHVTASPFNPNSPKQTCTMKYSTNTYRELTN